MSRLRRCGFRLAPVRSALPWRTALILALIAAAGLAVWGAGRIAAQERSQSGGEAAGHLRAHPTPVAAGQYTPDGSLLATAGFDHTAKLWKPGSGELVRTLRGHQDILLDLAVSPDGFALATAANDNTVKLWDLPSDKPLASWSGHAATVTSLAVSSEGRLALSGDANGIVKLWNRPEGKLLQNLPPHTGEITAAAFRSDAEQWATGDTEGVLRLWTPGLFLDEDPTAFQNLYAHHGAVTGTIFRPTNQSLLTSGADGTIKRWRLPATPPVVLAEAPSQQDSSQQGSSETSSQVSPHRVALANNGAWALSADQRGLRVVNVSDREIRPLEKPAGTVHAVDLSPDNNTALTGNDAGTLQFWNVSEGTETGRLTGHRGTIHDVAFHPHDNQGASVGEDGTIRLWRQPADPQKLTGHEKSIAALALSPNGQLAVSAGDDMTARLWNLENGQSTATLQGHEQPLSAAAFRFDNAQAATGDRAGVVRLWNVDGESQGRLGAHTEAVTDLAYHPQGELLASTAADGTAKLWQLPLPQPKTLDGHQQAVHAVAVSSDGGQLVSGGADGTLRLFDLASGEMVRMIEEEAGAITSLAFSSDDSVVIGGDESPYVTVRRLEKSDKPPWRLEAHPGAVTAVEPLGNRLVSVGEDGTLRFWQRPAAAEELPAFKQSVTATVTSRDGKLLATSGERAGKPAVVIRNLETGRRLATLLGHAKPVTAMRFGPEGQRFVTGSADQTARLWDLSDPKFPELGRFTDHQAAVTAVAVGPDGNSVLSGDANGALRFWSFDESIEPRNLKGHQSRIVATAVDPASGTLISASADKTVRFWKAANGQQSQSINTGAAATAMAVTADAARIAVGVKDGTVKVYNRADGQLLHELGGYQSPVVSLDYSPKKDRLASLTAAGRLRLWDAEGRFLEGQSFSSPQEAAPPSVAFGLKSDSVLLNGVVAEAFPQSEMAEEREATLQRFPLALQRLIVASEKPLRDVAPLPDGKRVVTGGDDGTVRLWNLQQDQPERTFAIASSAADESDTEKTVPCVAVIQKGNQVMAGSTSGVLHVWDLTGEAKNEPIIFRHGAAIRAVQPNVDGSRIATCGDEGIVRLWDLARERELQRFSGHEAAVLDVAWAPDNKTVVSCGAEGSLRVRQTAIVRLFEAHEGTATAVAFLDGERFATTGDEGAVRFWNVDGPMEAAFNPEAGPLRDFVIDGESPRLATGGDTGGVVLWSAGEETPSARIETPAAVRGLSFSGEGQKLAVAGDDRRVRIYATETSRLLEEVALPPPVEDEAGAQESPETAAPAGGLKGVGLLPDGDRLLVAAGQTGRLYQLSLLRLISQDEPVRSVAYLPEGQRLATGGDNATVHLWDLKTGQEIRRFGGNAGPINSLAVTQDGTQIVSAGDDQTVRLWNVQPASSETEEDKSENGAEEASPSAPQPVAPVGTFTHPAAVQMVRPTADGKRLIAGGEDGVVRLWDIATGEELQRFPGHTRSVTGLAVDSQQKRLVSAAAGGAVRLWHIAAEDVLPAHDGRVEAVAYLGSGSQFATAGSDGLVRLWDQNFEQLRPFEGSTGPLAALAVASDNGQLAAGSEEGTVLVWKRDDGELLHRLETPAAVRRLDYSPDNQRLCVTGEDGVVRIYSIAEQTLLQHIADEAPRRIALFSPDGRTILTGGEDKLVQSWRYVSPKAVRTFTGHGGGVYSIAFRPDGRGLASCSADGTVRIWDVAAGNQIHSLSGHDGPVSDVAYSPDGALLISGGADKTVRLWDVVGGRQLKQLAAGDGAVYAVAFSPDGETIAAAGADKTVRLFHAATGEVLQTIDGHSDFIHDVTFNGQGNRVLSCGYGGNLFVWNPAGGGPLFESQLQTASHSAAYSPDGSRIVVAAGDGRVYFRQLPAAAR